MGDGDHVSSPALHLPGTSPPHWKLASASHKHLLTLVALLVFFLFSEVNCISMGKWLFQENGARFHSLKPLHRLLGTKAPEKCLAGEPPTPAPGASSWGGQFLGRSAGDG